MIDKLATALLIIFIIAFAAWFIRAESITGPGCKKDPEWLGYCAQIIPHQ